MKSELVIDVKQYKSVDGELHDKKKDAMDQNLYIARQAALKVVFVSLTSIANLNGMSIDRIVGMMAANPEQFIAALTEEE